MMEKTLFPKCPGSQGRRTGLWTMLTVREARWAYISQRNWHCETGHLLENPNFGVASGGPPRWWETTWYMMPPLSPQFFCKAPKSQGAGAQLEQQAQGHSREARPGVCWSCGANWVSTSHDIVWANFWDALRSLVTSGHIWVHLGPLSPQLGCEQCESKILVKVIPSLCAVNTVLLHRADA